jgi:hypothetical protein
MSKNTTKPKKTSQPTEPPKRKNQGPLTLAPLEFEEALAGLLATPPPPKEDKPPAKESTKRGKGKTQQE